MKNKKRTYKIGTRFQGMFNSCTPYAMPELHRYILAKTDYHPCFAGLVNLKSGELWTDPIMINNHAEVTNKELFRIIGSEHWKSFKLIK